MLAAGAIALVCAHVEFTHSQHKVATMVRSRPSHDKKQPTV